MGTRPEASLASPTSNLKSEATYIRVMLKWTGAVLVVLNIGSTAATTCPCVTGSWKYRENSYSYCNNPNGAKTAWCPKELNDDGTYTSDLPFAFCEGDALTECDKLKDANKPACPCVEGGEWKYGGQSQLYCADPSGSGLLWCATQTDSAGNYMAGKYAKCTADILDSCEALEDAEPESICPCVSGGQWTFDGKPQSYCQKPNGIGRARWCPKEAGPVTTASLGNTKLAYCTGKVLKACQQLEGTRLPTQCPCVEGGQFIYKNTPYSYCENTNWCATEVDANGKFNGKFAKCKKAKIKSACHDLHELTTQPGKDALFGPYTKAATGCPCWYDMTRSDCACCEADGVQCGAPMQQHCTKKDVLVFLQTTGLFRTQATLAISTLPGQIVPGVLLGVLSAVIMETRVQNLQQDQDAGTQRMLVTVIPCQETACISMFATPRQNANSTSSLENFVNITHVNARLAGPEMVNNAMTPKGFRALRHCHPETFL